MTKSVMLREVEGNRPSVADGLDTLGIPTARGVGPPREARPGPTTEVPPWVRSLVPVDQAPWHDEASQVAVRVARGDDFELVSLRCLDAATLDAEGFEEATSQAYGRLAEILASSPLGSVHPIRLWNFIPGILEPLGGLPHRYMVFNAGRLAGFRAWLRPTEGGFWRAIATATGVGNVGSEGVVHCLAARRPGVAVENPRQRPAYRYSALYGPKPPCFARATRLDGAPSGRPWLLVGGTASVLGEHTAHPHDLGLQVDETLRNLAALAAAGLGGGAEGETEIDWLGRFRHLRIYHPEPGDGPEIVERLRPRFSGVEGFELCPATLCRPDLRVEIEGVVEAP